MNISNKKVGVLFGVLSALLVSACDDTDMVGPVVLDAYLNPHSESNQKEGDGGGGGY